MSWPPTNSRVLDPESINRSKLPRALSVSCSQKLPQVDSHQSSQEVTSHTRESTVSKEETCEWDRETEHFCDSLTFSRVIEARPGGTAYGPGKEEEEVLWYFRCQRPGTGRNQCTVWSITNMARTELVSSRRDCSKGERGK